MTAEAGLLTPAELEDGLLRAVARGTVIPSLDSEALSALVCRDTAPGLARLVGGVLHASSVGSEDIVDAHVVAAAVETGGGVVRIADVEDLVRLASPYRSVAVEGVRPGGST